MAANQFHFDHFTVDAHDRRLSRDGETIDLNNRYFDALALLLSEQGRLVTKDRFLDEVWSGVPVTDEALDRWPEIMEFLGQDVHAAADLGHSLTALQQLVDNEKSA